MAMDERSTAWIRVAGLGLWVALGGCDLPDPEDALDTGDDIEFREAGEPQPCGLVQPPDPVAHVPTFDCSESQDVGYDSGTPFDITVVTMDGKPVEKDTANAFWVMREAAAADGVDIHINSGFRTMAEQEYFWMCYQCGCCNNGNLAAQPGYSNHQSGHALDLNASAPGVYNWLAQHGGAFGFTETVPSENWHWEWWGGGPGGGVCDIASPPAGSVDAATCETIAGWAQDPDTPEAHLEVRVVFDGAPGDPLATELPLVADRSRDDLCDALGSCDHAFELELPLALRDGEPHTVRVFAVDSDGGEDAELVVDPPQVQCAPPPLVGVRRPLADLGTFDTWAFSDLWDLAHVDAGDLIALDEGPELGAAPFLVTDAGGTTAWLVDKGVRRPIPGPEVADAWRFDLQSASTLDADQLADIPEGTPLRATPLLATADGEQLWLIDDAQSVEGGSDGDGDGGAGEGGDDGSDGGGGADDDGDATEGDGGGLDGGSESDEDTGCACRARPDSGGRWPVLVLGLLVAGVRRSRRC